MKKLNKQKKCYNDYNHEDRNYGKLIVSSDSHNSHSIHTQDGSIANAVDALRHFENISKANFNRKLLNNLSQMNIDKESTAIKKIREKVLRDRAR
jgi:hypothetical protein